MWWVRVSFFGDEKYATFSEIILLLSRFGTASGWARSREQLIPSAALRNENKTSNSKDKYGGSSLRSE
jgi:hypothetical protein